jgi:hypothetical protein
MTDRVHTEGDGRLIEGRHIRTEEEGSGGRRVHIEKEGGRMSRHTRVEGGLADARYIHITSHRTHTEDEGVGGHRMRAGEGEVMTDQAHTEGDNWPIEGRHICSEDVGEGRHIHTEAGESGGHCTHIEKEGGDHTHVEGEPADAHHIHIAGHRAHAEELQIEGCHTHKRVIVADQAHAEDRLIEDRTQEGESEGNHSRIEEGGSGGCHTPPECGSAPPMATRGDVIDATVHGMSFFLLGVAALFVLLTSRLFR